MKNLYFFTVKYPFTKYAECFIEDEIVYLSEKFNRVTIIPLEREGIEVKALPSNCMAFSPLFLDRIRFVLQGIFNWKVAKEMIPLLLIKGILFDKVKFCDWLKAYFTANNLLNSSNVRSIYKTIQPEDVCYFYWGKWSNLLAYFWKGKCRMVSRFHGEGDLWEEIHNGYVPLRNKVVESLNAAVFISKKGEQYFLNRYPSCKTAVFPLGSNDINYFKKTPSKKFRVLSCSTVSDLKRVSLIYESLLSLTNMQVEWTHIGDGPRMEHLKQLIYVHSPSHVSVKLTGALNHDEVMQYYTEHCFDIFINLSTNEGVPVSIMEAISCNIPVVATNVGGNSEIVTKETGMLVNSNPNPQEVADAINLVKSGQYEPRAFWYSHYCAQINYKAFANFIYSL